MLNLDPLNINLYLFLTKINAKSYKFINIKIYHEHQLKSYQTVLIRAFN